MDAQEIYPRRLRNDQYSRSGNSWPLAATERNRLQENECFKAGRQRGATPNDKPIKVSTTNEVDKSLLATGFPYDHRDFRDFF